MNLLPIFRVELAVFSVSGVLKHLLDGIFGTALYLGERVLIILRERHVEHRSGYLFFIGQALVPNLGESFPIKPVENSLPHGGILDPPGVHIDTGNMQAHSLVEFRACHRLKLGVGRGGPCSRSIDFIILESRFLRWFIHLPENNLLQHGLITPPFIVRHHRNGLLGRVKAAVFDREGSTAPLGMQIIHKALIIDLRIFQRRMQNKGEQGVQGVERLRECHLYVEVIFFGFHAFNISINIRGHNIVFPVSLLLSFPGGLQGFHINRRSVVELGLGIQHDLDDNLLTLFAGGKRLGIFFPEGCSTVKV